ncbi:MAG: hypothetical protein GY778_09015 [bacterium]|nr:hypothetical protein [bacterium]
MTTAQVQDQPTTPVSRRDAWLGAALVLAVCWLLNAEDLWRPETLRGFESNAQIGEAQAWWNGRLDLPERVWDTALKDGRVLSHFPPAFSIISAALIPWFGGVPHWFFVLLAAAVPVCAYVLFLRLTRSAVWAVILAVGYVCGTSVWPVLAEMLRYGKPYHVNHTLASIGVLLILIDYFGRRRIWLGALGLMLAAWSRQATIAYALILLLAAWWGVERIGRRRRLVIVALTGLLLGTVYCGLNVLKFGHPLRTGYMLNHEGRTDSFARDAREVGVVSVRWVPRNLYYSNLGPPRVGKIDVAGESKWYVKPNTKGTGIWWMSPLLLLIFFDLRRLVRDPSTAAPLAAALMTYAILMLWYSTGEDQRGYNRYSLDYLPVILALIAPRCMVGRRRWLTPVAVAWSLVYFRILLPLPHLEVPAWGG